MGWEATVIAISTATIAVFFIGIGVVTVVFVRDLSRVVGTIDKTIKTLESQTGPVLKSAREIVDDTQKAVKTMKKEAKELTATSREMRKKVTRAADTIENRLLDLDALVDVAQVELEDTVLDVAAALRTGRKSATIVKAFKRALTGRRRR